MKFLFDTNVVISAEPTAPQHVEPRSPLVAELLGRLGEARHQVYLHPVSLEEMEHDADAARREMRRVLVKKYPRLPSPPPVPNALTAKIGTAPPGSHDAVDHLLLAAVFRDAVHYMVTDDRDLLRTAQRAGLGDRVVAVDDALGIVRRLFPVAVPPPPAVREVLAHELDETDPIFESVRADYADFDDWLAKCRREHRRCWIVLGDGGRMAGVAIVKDEERGLKICTFKIADHARGNGYGELLLKSVLAFLFANRYDRTYVTVFPKHVGLTTLFEAFGFAARRAPNERGELILTKALKFTRKVYKDSAPLDFNIRYGPLYAKVHDVRLFAVPIIPEYHRLLFPDAERQLDFLAGRSAFGNSIRKAYLCNASIRRIDPGSVLLFYRSDDERLVRCVGVVEATLRSSDADTVARFVGLRTVYRYDEIEAMCRRPVLAILFRHARILSEPLAFSDMIGRKALKAAPRSIAEVREEGAAWVRDRLELWP